MNEARLRAELVQVAALAVAAIEDLDSGSATMAGLPAVLADVIEERDDQDTRWGAQHYSPAVWLALLVEQVGTAAREVARPCL